MTVPAYDAFIEPLLRYLAEHAEGASVVDVYETLATRLGLVAADRAEFLPSGAQAVYKNRIGWAHDRLKRRGLSSSPRRGFWKLTNNGVAFAAQNKTLSEAEVEELATVDRTSRLKPKKDSIAGTPSAPDLLQITTEGASPEERIEIAIGQLRDSVGHDLLESIGRAPPAFFEQLVLDLLHAMGYGTSRSDLQRVGGAGDGGIDGIISLDRLGLEKVYVQAKRWKNSVGSPEIQGFMGALQLQGASKGVFITTSTFTRDAKQAAIKARGTIVLVDGAQLSTLMMDYGIGVSHEALRIPKVNGDYFEEG